MFPPLAIQQRLKKVHILSTPQLFIRKEQETDCTQNEVGRELFTCYGCCVLTVYQAVSCRIRYTACMPEKHMFCFPACLFCVFILSCCFVCFLFVSLLLYSSSAPRMVNNYKRTSSPRSPTNSGELFTPAHEENVRFIHDSESASEGRYLTKTSP